MTRGKRHLENFDQEIRDHIERETQENLERGMPPEEARQQALRKFGNVEIVREDTRAVWTAVWFEQLLQDIRYAVRALYRNPGFAAVVVLTLALGIGMNTAVFSVFNAVLLRPLPYPNPERLLWVTTYEKEWNEEFVDDATFKEWREQAVSFEQFAAYETRDTTIRAVDSPVRARVALVSHDFWELSGAVPALGRLPGHGEREILLSHRFFERWFHSDSNVVGRAVDVSGESVIVAGVLPENARFPFPRAFLDFLILDDDDIAGYVSVDDTNFSALNGVAARLKPSVSPDAGRAELAVIRARGAEKKPGRWDHTELRVVPLHDKIVGQARRPFLILLAAVAFVLLIACANVANLLLARASAREKEIAIRASIGAGRIRVLRQFLVESAVLAFLGGAAGVLLAAWGVGIIARLAPQAIPRLEEATISGNVLAFAAGLTVVTAFLFGLAPGVGLWKPDLHALLKDGRAASARSGSLRVRRLLVAIELGLSVVLLVGAGLMVKSFWLMYEHPPGFHPDRIVMMKIPVSGSQYFGNLQRQRAYLDEVLLRLGAMPGIKAAGLVYRGSAHPQNTWEGSPPLLPGQEPPTMVGTAVSAAYGGVMGLRVVRGRWLTDTEPEAVIVINESLARRDFPGEDPIGKRLKGVGPVVGVVADLKFSKLDAKPEPEFFVSLTNARRLDNAAVVVQTMSDGSAAAPAIQRLVSDIDKTQPVYDVKTLEQALADSIAPRRLNLFLLGSFAAAAMVLALIGIYGVTAYSVARRTHEIGIRMTLGAQRQEVVRMVLRQGMKMALTGIAAGLVAAVALTRVMASLLYDVAPTDPQTFVAVAAALTVTALIACWLPALKAALVDPIIALRYE